MKITTTWSDLNRIPWNSIFECAHQYRQNNPGHNDNHYQEYMLETWGIDQGGETIRIVDDRKYMMFLLRWA